MRARIGRWLMTVGMAMFRRGTMLCPLDPADSAPPVPLSTATVTRAGVVTIDMSASPVVRFSGDWRVQHPAARALTQIMLLRAVQAEVDRTFSLAIRASHERGDPPVDAFVVTNE